MNKKEKKPLSKAVGEWDNGFSDREKIDYTYNEIRNAFLADRRYNQMMRVNQLQLILRGSASKNSANADSDDVDIHCNFNCDIDLCDEKDNVEALLINRFGEDYVERHIKSIVVLPKKKRLKVDLIVCRQEQGYVSVWNDDTEEEEAFYPTKDQSELGKRNDATNGRFLNMVRAFKTVRNMVCDEHEGEYHIPSHVIECMLFWVKAKTYKKRRDNNAEQDARKLFLAVEQSVRARLKNIEDLDEATEINGIKPLFSNWDEYNIVLEFWNDLHDYLTSNYDFER